MAIRARDAMFRPVSCGISNYFVGLCRHGCIPTFLKLWFKTFINVFVGHFILAKQFDVVDGRGKA